MERTAIPMHQYSCSHFPAPGDGCCWIEYKNPPEQQVSPPAELATSTAVHPQEHLYRDAREPHFPVHQERQE